MLDKFFGITEAHSTVRREVIGGLTTFATMSYIVFVQPTVLAMAGMDFGSVLLATCVSSAAACLLMGFLANYPIALAPGMGENFLFTFTVCMAMGFSWQSGLTIVLFSGLLFTALSLFKFREKIMDVFPLCLKNAIGPAIGLFIAFVGLQWSGIIVLDSATMVALGNMKHAAPLIAIAGFFLIAVLMAYKVNGGILIGILFTTGLGLLFGVIPRTLPEFTWSTETFFNLGFSELWARWQDALLAIGLFFFLDLFDTVGTLVGVSNQAGLMTEDGKLPRAGRAFLSDALGTCIGALCGTSTVTSYIESATGVAAGARTGLAAIITGLCFFAAILFAPVIALVGTNVAPAYYESLGIQGALVPMYPAVAPALIAVGFLMLAPLGKIKWEDITESLPAFLTIAMMVLGYGITEGIAAGCISFAVIKTAAGRRREVHPIMYGTAVAFLLRYVFLK
ncbi:MAG: Guanine/hypoxanthine permease PbuG [Candidatus Hydrogenedentes bacterium ADurb.Bin101]|nr:MAG: Guanine/hypoxanthine permease PbuG [Candidatus Hydrogenedentes bacterium ADurb.Bin101]HOC69171.1 NCS2 family permease [Candidatus Hydrogenedentota bacterium]